MKRTITAVIAALFLFFAGAEPVEVYAEEAPEVSAGAAVLISADTGEVIFSKNSGTKLPMASTTKIMTVLLTLESGDLYSEFTVDSDAIRVEGSSMGLQEGDTVTKYALCCGMLLPSGNDAANAAAVRVAGSIEAFVDMMNEKARVLGLSRTFFVTPSGLEGEGHGSSAYDMALLAREALKLPDFREICSQTSMTVSYGCPPYVRRLRNTNRLLSLYDGVYGVKTGFTDEAGRCLVSACERDGKDLICVTLNAPNDWNDHIALYDYGFRQANLTEPQLPEELTMPLVGAECDTVRLVTDGQPVTVTTTDADPGDFTCTLISPPFAYAPVTAGEELAQLSISLNGREVRRIPLFAAEDITAKKAPAKAHRSILDTLLSRLGRLFS
ncbi:MAG: D-alanyl-D-alanine carboxypeptidase [Ruminococcus sp.]|nr:D-alanyl-D-alanine carboxypeptidase [Ruminococcus sp.]